MEGKTKRKKRKTARLSSGRAGVRGGRKKALERVWEAGVGTTVRRRAKRRAGRRE